MARYERSIKIAFDKLSGEILEADDVFDKKKEAFEVRRQFHKDEVELYCCECHQKLEVSTSKYDRLHFKHQKNAEYCILKDENLSPAELEQFTKILKAKESTRHKELKNKIGERLRNIPGIDPSSLAIDDRFIVRGSEKRRPDVYCKYHEKEIVFEIQLSDLSLRYILSRHDFYREHGIYLVWILDNFNVRDQSQLERDIKYLTKYQNFFKLDETTDEFKLACEYKYPFLSQDNEVHSKWIKKSVLLNDVQFDEAEYQIFFFDFNKRLQEQEEAKKIRDLELQELEQKRVEQLRENERQKAIADRLKEVKGKSNAVIQEIKRLRSFHAQVFDSVRHLLRDLDEEETTHLNSVLQLDSTDKEGQPLFFGWLVSAKQEDTAFIEFLMTSVHLEFDVNARAKNGTTAFQVILQNPKIGSFAPLKALFKKGYILTQEDEIAYRAIKEGYETDATILIYKLCSSFNNRIFVENIFTHAKLICILYSIKDRRIIGFNYKPTEWIAFANNAVQYYSSYWEYIELALKHFGVWDDLIKSDRKGTFQQKVTTLYNNLPVQKFDFDTIFKVIFPEMAQREISKI